MTSGYRTISVAVLGLALVACKGDATKQAAGGAGSGAAQVAGGAGSGAAGVEPTARAAGSSGSASTAVAMPASWAGVLGDKPATFGPTLASFGFGKAVDVAAIPHVPNTNWGLMGEAGGNVRLVPNGSEPKVRVDLDIESGTLFAVNVELYTNGGSIPQDNCAAFVAALESTWGPAPDRAWFDRANGVRMLFRDTCRLRFERYVDSARWIGPDAASTVPVMLIGKPTTELASRVGPNESLDADLTYRAPGIETGDGATTIDVYTKSGTIRGLGVDVRVSDVAIVRDRISSAFNAKPTRDANTTAEVWATSPPIRLYASRGGSVRVEVGNTMP